MGAGKRAVRGSSNIVSMKSWRDGHGLAPVSDNIRTSLGVTAFPVSSAIRRSKRVDASCLPLRKREIVASDVPTRRAKEALVSPVSRKCESSEAMPLITSGVSDSSMELTWGVVDYRRKPDDKTCMQRKVTARKQVRAPEPVPELSAHFIQAWRKHRRKTQVQVAEHVELELQKFNPDWSFTDASLSRIERGEQPYNQRQLDALVTILECSQADLLGRDPTAPCSLPTLLDGLSKAHAEKVVDYVNTLRAASAFQSQGARKK